MDQQVMSSLAVITDEEFNRIARLVYDTFGVNLTEQKKALVMGRLSKVLRELGYSTFGEYYDYVASDKTGKAIVTLIDRITTNHTFFFREIDHFHFLEQKVLPEFEARAGSGDELRFWCAGCSSGEEPYTLAMVLDRYFGDRLSRYDFGILATDISTVVLAQALEGLYPEERLREAPPDYRKDYMTDEGGGWLRVKPRIRNMVTYKRLNLMRSDFPFRSAFQVIFCRNVMIYFDSPTRDALVDRYYRYTADNGYLFIGHSESLNRESSPYEYVRPAVYHKKK